MQRNTLVVVILLGIFTVIVIIANVRGPRTASVQTENQLTSQPTPSPKLISDSTCGISFSYPETLTNVDIGTGGVTLVNTKKEGETIVVVCQEDIPRVPLPENKIETLQIGSVSASLYHDASAKDGTPVDKLIFTHPTLKNTDIYIAGYGTVYDEFIKTISINAQ